MTLICLANAQRNTEGFISLFFFLLFQKQKFQIDDNACTSIDSVLYTAKRVYLYSEQKMLYWVQNLVFCSVELFIPFSLWLAQQAIKRTKLLH